MRDIRDDDGGSDLAKNKGGGRRRGAFFNRPCGLLLLVLFIFSSARSSKGSSMSSSSSSPTSFVRVLVPLFLFLLLRLLRLLLERWRGTRMLNGAYLLSSLRLLEGVIVLGLNGATLFPSKDSLAFDIVGFQVLDIVGLTDGLDCQGRPQRSL